MKCNKCGLENIESAKFCAYCGEKIESENQSRKCQICGSENEVSAKYCAVCGSQLSDKVYTYSVETSTKKFSEDKFGTTSMVVGIVSIATTILCCMFPFGLIGGIVATITGIISIRKTKNRGKAIAGIVCGVLAFVIALITIISLINLMNDPEFLAQLEEILKQYENVY